MADHMRSKSDPTALAVFKACEAIPDSMIVRTVPLGELQRFAEALLWGEGRAVNFLRFHCQDLIAEYGSVRKAADALGIEHTYLYRLAAGEKDSPSDDTLLKLGLERVTSYRKLGAKAGSAVPGGVSGTPTADVSRKDADGSAATLGKA